MEYVQVTVVPDWVQLEVSAARVCAAPNVAKIRAETNVIASHRQPKRETTGPRGRPALTAYLLFSSKSIPLIWKTRILTLCCGRLHWPRRGRQRRYEEIRADEAELMRMLGVGAEKARVGSAPTLELMYER